MNIQLLVRIGSLYFVTKVKFFILTVLVLNIKKVVGNKNIITNIFRVQARNSVMCGYFCIGFIDFMLAGKKLTDFTNMVSPHDFKKNDKIILSYFKDE